MRSGQIKIPVSSSYFNSPAWYLRERTPVTSVHDRRTRKYFELDERTTPDGFKGEVLVEKDYPITPAYVSSFASSSDYRSDPLGSVASAPQRFNLGDITQLQKALGLDFETARRLYSSFRSVAEAVARQRDQQPKDKEDPVSAGKEGE